MCYAKLKALVGINLSLQLFTEMLLRDPKLLLLDYPKKELLLLGIKVLGTSSCPYAPRDSNWYFISIFESPRHLLYRYAHKWASCPEMPKEKKRKCQNGVLTLVTSINDLQSPKKLFFSPI